MLADPLGQVGQLCKMKRTPDLSNPTAQCHGLPSEKWGVTNLIPLPHWEPPKKH